MEKNIATQNAEKLASLSVIFCAVNGIPVTEQLAAIMSATLMGNIARWYKANGRPDFDPKTDLICEEAIKSAFGRLQELNDIATVRAMVGIGAE